MRPFLFSVLLLITLSSCNVFYKTANTSDDVYYSRKANKEKTVIIPDVDVDEIIKKNPPQYGTPPTNKVDDEVTPNYLAQAGFYEYKQRQDSLNKLYPNQTGYYDPNPMPSYNEGGSPYYPNSYNNNSWLNNTGISMGFGYNPYYGFSPSIGYRWNRHPSYGYGYGYGYGYNNYPYDPFYSYYYPYNSWGYNSYYSPYSYWGWNSWYSPYYYPYYSGGCYDCNNNSGGSSNNGQGSIEHPRPGMGSTTPAPPGSGVRPGDAGSSGMVAQPQGQGTTEPTKPAMMRPGSNYNYSAPGAARLENVNGRMIYTPPAPIEPQPMQQQYARPGGGGQQVQRPSQNQNGERMMRPSYNNGNNFQPSFRPSQSFSPASSGGGMTRPGGGMGGGGGSIGHGSGGMQRPR